MALPRRKRGASISSTHLAVQTTQCPTDTDALYEHPTVPVALHHCYVIFHLIALCLIVVAKSCLFARMYKRCLRVFAFSLLRLSDSGRTHWTKSRCLMVRF